MKTIFKLQNKIYKVQILCLIFAFVLINSAFAQGRAVYGASIDESSSLVRLVNLDAGSVNLRVGSQKFSSNKTEASSYHQVVTDVFLLKHADKSYEFVAQKGMYYSIVVTKNDLYIMNDVAHTDKARAQIYFYNFTEEDAELKTKDGKTTVVPTIKSEQSSFVAVNPLNVKLSAFSNSNKIGQNISLRLSRGFSYSIFVYGNLSSVKTLFVKAEISK